MPQTTQNPMRATTSAVAADDTALDDLFDHLSWIGQPGIPIGLHDLSSTGPQNSPVMRPSSVRSKASTSQGMSLVR